MLLDHRAVLSGQRRDPLAVVMRGLLRAGSLPYRAAVALRNRRFDSGANPAHRCGIPVVSVGNLTTGGTGKTPIVCLLASWFRQRGVRVAIVSRGYGRGDADANDESLELHARLPDVPHLQDPDRVAAARIAVEELEAELILMDDGFQHRWLARDLDIVVIDATCPFGYGHLLPRGLLREPVKNLRRADLLILSRCDAVDSSALAEIESTLRRANDRAAILRSTHRPTTLLEHPDTTSPIDTLGGKRVAVLSAIGNPAAFETTVRHCGAVIVATRCLPDHDPYEPDTVRELRGWVESLKNRIDVVICTHKDLVKLRTDRLGGKPLAAVLIELTLHSDITPLEAALEKLLAR